MNTHDFSQDILAKIEEQHLEPRPRWQVLVMRAAWWALACVCLVFGGLAFASVLFFAREQGWDAWVARPHLATVFELIPLLWIGAFVLLIALVYLDVRATRRGYRYPGALLVGGILVGSALLGTAVYGAGLEAKPHEFLRERLPGYESTVPDPPLVWHRPELGRYAGMILATTTEGFVLKDVEGDEWSVRVATSSRWLLPTPPAANVRLKTLCNQVSTTAQLILVEARPLYRAPRPVLERALDRRLRPESLREYQNEPRRFPKERTMPEMLRDNR